MSSLPLVVGVPREVKTDEHRVAITPDGVLEMTHRDVRVVIEAGAGADSGITDDDYRAAGAEIVAGADAVWERAGLVLKVKEPQPAEFRHLRPGLVLFTYLHLAAYPEVARALLDARTTGIGYETVQRADGQLPLLVPMSEVAGRMAPQLGAHFLERRQGGRGVLLGGAPGVRPARVVVLGAGTVGWSAAWIAQGMEAEVLMLDRNIDKLRWVDQIHRGRIVTLASTHAAIARLLVEADLVIGAVLVPGGRAPVLVTDEMVRSMRPGAVIVDCAIDQGGCVEGIHETTHTDPVYTAHGVLHYAVGNVPGRGAQHVDVRVDERDAAVRGRARDPRSGCGGRRRRRPGRGRQHGRRPRSQRGCRGRVGVERVRTRRRPADGASLAREELLRDRGEIGLGNAVPDQEPAAACRTAAEVDRHLIAAVDRVDRQHVAEHFDLFGRRAAHDTSGTVVQELERRRAARALIRGRGARGPPARRQISEAERRPGEGATNGRTIGRRGATSRAGAVDPAKTQRRAQPDVVIADDEHRRTTPARRVRLELDEDAIRVLVDVRPHN